MRYSDIKKLFIFNSFIFSIIIVLGVIMLFRASFAANVSDGSNSSNVWDGVSRSSSLSGSGTESDPYLIQNANDLAYFVYECNSNSTFANTNKYVDITNNIYINDGYFDYNDSSYNGIVYYKDNRKYYVYKNKYYDTPNHVNEVGTLNQLDPISFTRCYIYGDSNVLSGLFYYSETSSQSFINTLYGGIEALDINNSVIIGKGNVGFINMLSTNDLWGMSFSGYIKNTSTSSTSTTGFVASSSYRHFDRIAVSGKIEAAGGYVGGLIGHGTNVFIDCCYSRGTISSSGVYTGGLIGYLQNGCTIDNSFRYGKINGSGTRGGLFGYVSDNSSISGEKNMVVDCSLISGQLIGEVNNLESLNLSLSNSYQTISSTAIIVGGYNNSSVSGFSYISRSSLLTVNRLNNGMGYLRAGQGPAISGYIWILKDGNIPTLSFDYYYAGTVKINLKRGSTVTDVTGGDPNTVQMYNRTATFQIELQSTYAHDTDIGKIEYYIRDGEYTTNVLSGSISYSHYDKNIKLEQGDCRSIYVKVTDVWGNVSYAHSYVLWYDGYKISESEGVDQATYNSDTFRNINSRSLYNIHVKHKVTKDSSLSFPSYSSSLKQYLRFPINALPTNTDIYLTELNSNVTYKYTTSSSTSYTNRSVNGLTYKVFDLSNLKSVFDNTYYNNTVSNYRTTNQINEDFIISFKLPSTANYNFGPVGAGLFSGVIAGTSPTNTTYGGTISGNALKDQSSSRTTYSLTSNTDSISFDSVGDHSYISFQLSKQAAFSNSYYVLDHEYVQKNYSLNIDVLSATPGSSYTYETSPFVLNNFSFNYLAGSYNSSFNFKSDTTAYYNFTPVFYENDSGLKVTNFNLEMTEQNNNFLNLDPNKNYKIRVSVLSDGSSVVSKDISLVLTGKTIPIDNYSFTGSIDRNDRIINHTTGQTSNSTDRTNVHFKYSYNSLDLHSSGKLLMKLYRYDVSNNNVEFTSINPNTIFNRTFTELNGAYDSNMEVCYPNVDFTQPLKLKSNIPTGRYVLEMILYDNFLEKNISRERFNLIVQ